MSCNGCPLPASPSSRYSEYDVLFGSFRTQDRPDGSAGAAVLWTSGSLRGYIEGRCVLSPRRCSASYCSSEGVAAAGCSGDVCAARASGSRVASLRPRPGCRGGDRPLPCVDADCHRFSFRHKTLLPQSALHSPSATQLEKTPVFLCRPMHRFRGGAAVSLA